MEEEMNEKKFKLFRIIDELFQLIVCSLVPNPIFIEVFIFIRIQGTDRTTVNSAKRHKSHMTCFPARKTREKGEKRIKHEHRNYKMIDVLFPSPQIDFTQGENPFTNLYFVINIATSFLMFNYQKEK